MNYPELKKQVILVASLSIIFAEVITSAMKKVRKYTGLNGAIEISPNIFKISHLPGRFMIGSGLNIMQGKNKRASIRVGHLG